MRILYLDIDTLRPDHLGCYGYHRETSPNIDRLASEGVRFENCYVSDAPCLPSRASMFLGQFGIHTGVVNHGGGAADPWILPEHRGFSLRNRASFIERLREMGYYTASISPFAERHSAYWFYRGWMEMHNTGKGGNELADDVLPLALRWISDHGKQDDWMLHVNVWDPHTPYRAPEEFGNPFSDDPLEGWYTEEIRQRQWNTFGPGTPQEPYGNYGRPVSDRYPRQPDVIESMDDYRKVVDGYDCGIRYADQACGQILDALAAQGVLDETVVIVTSDHGENFGELNVIGDHATADHVTSRVPMIVRWPGGKGARVDNALHYQTDLAATVVELLGGQTPEHWDGVGFADAFRSGSEVGRDYLVVSQNCWSCQRSVRWDDYMMVRSYHTGLKDYPERMLFNVAEDPHEINDLAESQPELVDKAQAMLEEWTAKMMASSDFDTDPLWTVLHEGGPFHTRHAHEGYLQRLRQSGREQHAAFLEKNPSGIA